MPQVISRPTAVETTLGITFQIGRLPVQTIGAVQVSLRNPVEYTITAAAATLGAESVTLTADTTVFLDAGEILTFGTTKVTLAEGKTIATTPTPVATLPLTAAVTEGASDVTNALVFVSGCYNATVTPNIKNVDVTNYLSGVGVEMVTTGNNKTMSLEFNLIYGDKGGEILREIAYDKSYIGREFYFLLAFPSGEKHEGAALLNSASPTQGVQDKRSFQCEAQIQGDSYIYTPPDAIVVTP